MIPFERVGKALSVRHTERGRRAVRAIFIFLFCVLPPRSVTQEAGSLPATEKPFLSLTEVVQQVLTSNPALKASRANWEAMTARVPQARAWEDLLFGVDVERSGTDFLGSYMGNEWMLSQSIPLSGKNRLRGQAALAEAAMAFADSQRRQLDLLARARVAYFRYASARAQLGISEKTEQVLTELIAEVRRKNAAVVRLEADIIAGETELATVLESRSDIEQEISDRQSQLNVLMNRPAYQELLPPNPSRFRPVAVSAFGAPPSPHTDTETEFTLNWPLFQHELQVAALKNRPELVRAAQHLLVARAELKLANREWIPDPEVRVTARQFEGGGKFIDEYDTGLFLNLPWLNRSKYKAAIREAQYKVDASEQELDALRAETLGLVREQSKKVETAQTHYRFTLERVLPLAQQSFASMHKAFQANQATFLELLAAQRTLREAESMLEHHLADYLSAIADIEAMTGANLRKPPGAPAN